MVDHLERVPNWRILAELAVFFGGTGLIAWLYLAPDALTQMRPHPFGLAVLVASLQYGTWAGALATAVAVAIQALLGWPQPIVGEDQFATLARQWAEPCLWIALSLLVGELRDRQIGAHNDLRAAYEQADRDLAALAGQCAILRQRIRALELDAGAQQPTTTTDTLRSLAEIHSGSHEPAAAAAALARLGRDVLAATRISLWRRSGAGLALDVSAGWDASRQWRNRFAPGDLLHVAIVDERRTLDLLQPGDRPALTNEGVLATPLLDPNGGEVIGMLKVEGIETGRLAGLDRTVFALFAAAMAGQLRKPSAASLRAKPADEVT